MFKKSLMIAAMMIFLVGFSANSFGQTRSKNRQAKPAGAVPVRRTTTPPAPSVQNEDKLGNFEIQDVRNRNRSTQVQPAQNSGGTISNQVTQTSPNPNPNTAPTRKPAGWSLGKSNPTSVPSTGAVANTNTRARKPRKKNVSSTNATSGRSTGRRQHKP